METLSINPQVITDANGNELGVFLTSAEFESLLEELEELEDIKAYDEAKARPNQEFIPYEQAIEEIKNGLVK
jgi:PHD/YefM family antitoxin component YafN of YafNO toxin-antitoxin module